MWKKSRALLWPDPFRVQMPLRSCAGSSKFTGAEMRVLRCLVQGMSYIATAEALGVDARTVKYHVSSMLQKTNFENKLQLAVAAIETRLTANFPEE